MTSWVSRECVKKDAFDVPKSIFKELVMTLMASTPVFHKKSKII